MRRCIIVVGCLLIATTRTLAQAAPQCTRPHGPPVTRRHNAAAARRLLSVRVTDRQRQSGSGPLPYLDRRSKGASGRRQRHDGRVSRRRSVAGLRLPGVNDGFTGRAPDLGAYEIDRPLPFYGVRP